MGHENDCFCAIVECVFDGRYGTDYTLIVCDSSAVEWDIEVNSDEDSLACCGLAIFAMCLTRNGRKLPFRSRSLIESFDERDMMQLSQH